MQRPISFSSLINKGLFCGIIVLPTACKQQKKDTPQTKPNFVYILADDLGYGDLSCYGQQKFKTPNIDQLAKEGILFTQHYAGCTVCAPSRASLLTGKHPGHAYIRGNREISPEGQAPLPKSETTLFEMLKNAGYVTGAFGKWGLGYPASEGDPNNKGVDEFYGFNCQRMGHSYYPYYLWHNQEKVMLKGNEGTQTNDYAPALIHEQAIRFLEKNKDTTFFLYYPTIIPHAELVVPDSLMKRFRGKLEPEKPYKGVDSGKLFRVGGYASQKEPHAAFAAMVTLLDQQLGELITKLKELGIYDNTIIVFTSDNGPHKEGGADPDYFNSNGELRGYKRDLYEGGIRVPMIINWGQNVKAGTTSNHVSAFWDILPTFCEAAKITSPPKTDGISLLPTLIGGTQKEHAYLYWEFHGYKNGRQAVRMGKWKGIRTSVKNNPNANIELYDLENDLSETQNVADKNPKIVEQIAKIMEQQHLGSELFPFEYEKENK